MVNSAVKLIPGGTAPGGNMASAGMAICMGGSAGNALIFRTCEARADASVADACWLLWLRPGLTKAYWRCDCLIGVCGASPAGGTRNSSRNPRGRQPAWQLTPRRRGEGGLAVRVECAARPLE